MQYTSELEIRYTSESTAWGFNHGASDSAKFNQAFHWGISGNQQSANSLHRSVVKWLVENEPQGAYSVLRKSKRFDATKYPYEIKIPFPRHYSLDRMERIIEALGRDLGYRLG